MLLSACPMRKKPLMGLKARGVLVKNSQNAPIAGPMPATDRWHRRRKTPGCWSPCRNRQDSPTGSSFHPTPTRTVLRGSCQTAETRIRVKINPTVPARSRPSTGIGFFSTTCSTRRPPRVDSDLDIEADDLHIDGHHTVEDVGITSLGQAFHKAVGDKNPVSAATATPMCRWTSKALSCRWTFSGRPVGDGSAPYQRHDWQPRQPGHPRVLSGSVTPRPR